MTIESGAGGRDQLLDGFRAVAACGVVFSHAICYRFADAAFPGMHLLGRIAGPVSEISVQIFFVISGFIITTLLIREEARNGRPNLAAFYVRRMCRIVPPFAVLIAAVGLLDLAGVVQISGGSLAQAASFTCNTSLADCEWWVAHSWSLAVEEQFYLIWPLIFVIMPGRGRTPFLVALVAILLFIFIIRPHVYHANSLSFACIAIGALLATRPSLIDAIIQSARPSLWLLAAALLLVGPLTPAERFVSVITPFLICYLIFAARRLDVVVALLTARPVQILGLGSYSLYLWQQLFLAKPDLYVDGPPPLLILPLIVLASVYVTERPFIAIGQRLSRTFTRVPDGLSGTKAVAVPPGKGAKTIVGQGPASTGTH